MSTEHARSEREHHVAPHPPQRQPRPPEPEIEAQPHLLDLQQAIGNRAVQQVLQQGNLPVVQRWTQAEALERVPNAPGWAGEETTVRAVQRQLRRLGFYMQAIDGDYGHGTDSAMVEAFGGNEFRSLSADVVQERLRVAAPPEGRRGEHAYRFGEMFKDGLLDMTLGIGYDEALEAAPDAALINYQAALEARGFVRDAEAAARVYQVAGRPLEPSIANQYYVKYNALIYRPPAGLPRPIHAVIRLVTNTRGERGVEAQQSFRRGMGQSDVIFYAGHGRYGTGPDFDRNFGSFVLHDLDDPSVTQAPILDYDVLERTLKQEVRRKRLGRSAWQQFLWRHARGLIDVDFRNEGNLRINPHTPHGGEFGGSLINWALEQGHIQMATGEGGTLAREAEAHPEQRYRVVVFNGCRTRDYETRMRTTPGFTRESANVIETSRTVFGGDEVATLASFLDSILQQQSAEQTIREMDRVQETMMDLEGRSRGTFVSGGARYEPVIR